MDDKRTTVPCEPCGGTGKLSKYEVRTALGSHKSTLCKTCWGKGRRPLHLGDVREGWDAKGSDLVDTILGTEDTSFEGWAKARYNIGGEK